MKIKHKVVLIVILSILVLIGGGYIGVHLYLDSLLNKLDHEEVIEKDEAEIAPEVMEQVKERKVINIALFGADNATGTTNNGEERSDAMKIVSLDYDNKKIKMTSLERDVVVYIPGDHQKYGHLNWAHWFGGAELAVKTINYNFDMDITQYVTFSFADVQRLVDLIGGVEINLTSREVGQLFPVNGRVKKGLNTLDGNTAMAYCRIRKIDSDFSRMDRQNNVINAIIAKLKNKTVFELMDIVNEMLPYVTTNLTNNEIKEYLTTILTFDLANIETYKEPSGEYNDICTCPGLGGYLVRSYSDMVKNLHMNIYGNEDYVPSQTVLDNEARTYKTYGEFKER